MFGIIGIVAVIVFTIQVYKSANGTKRNGALWAMLTAAIGVGFQFVIPFIAGIVIAIAYMVGGSTPESLQSDITLPATLIGLAGIFISIAGMFLISRHVATVPDDPPMSVAVPPPPPQF